MLLRNEGRYLSGEICAKKGEIKWPDNEHKGDEDLQLFNILYRGLGDNLKNKREEYLFRSARQFYASRRKLYSGDSTLDIEGLDKKYCRRTLTKINDLR